jgi:hypothetical protein
VSVWAKARLEFNFSPLAEANGNEKTILLSFPSHLCDGLVKKTALALAKKNVITDNDLFGTVNILKAISLMLSGFLFILTKKAPQIWRAFQFIINTIKY